MKSAILIGAGAWGGSWAAVIAATSTVDLVGVVDLDVDLARDTAAAHGLSADRGFGDLSEACGAVEPDFAVLVSPPGSHREVALACLDEGLPVLVEKPLAPTISEARDIVRASESTGVPVAVSQNYRFKRAPRTVQSLVQQGLIGPIERATIRFCKNPPFTGFRTEMEDPLLIDMAIHHLDQVRGILGLEVDTVSATSDNPSWSRFAGDSRATARLTTKSGAIVHYQGSWSSMGPKTSWDGAWEIEGPKGAITWDYNQVRIRFASPFDTVFLPNAREIGELEMQADLVHVEHEERAGTLTAFRDALVTGEEMETAASDNLRSLALVLAAVASARNEGQSTHVDEFLSDGRPAD